MVDVHWLRLVARFTTTWGDCSLLPCDTTVATFLVSPFFTFLITLVTLISFFVLRWHG